MLLSNKNQMKNAFKLSSNLPPLSLPLKGGEQKRGLFKNRENQSAFTLVELAIVIVVLGILVSGIVAGQSIIKSSKVRSVISEYKQYSTAINAFKLEYGALPGDFKDASDYWDNVDDGNGDKKVVRTQGYEVGSVWEHLKEAEIIQGEYDSRADTSVLLSQSCGIRVPCSKYDGAHWAFGTSIHAPFHNNTTSNKLMLNSTARTNNAVLPRNVIHVKDAYNIDKKIDDGKPTRGRVGSYYNDGSISNGDCINFANRGYRLDNDVTCYMHFLYD
jgi:prepilin-type N-terminal cleavage/methylation domain-containing protein